jgi:hypothetical protein
MSRSASTRHGRSNHVPEGGARGARHRVRTQVLNHPEQGLLQFAYSSFQANDDPSLKLVIHTPV